jgi:hypothetical protein
MNTPNIPIRSIRRRLTALAAAARRHPREPGQLRAGAEQPVEPCYMTVLFGGHPPRR